MRYNQQSKNDYSDTNKTKVYLSSIQSSNPKLFFDKGTICIKDSGLIRIPGTKYDDRAKILRSYAIAYSEIIDYLKKSELDFIDNVPDFMPSHVFVMKDLVLRDYQQQAIRNW